jgi:hypothetical protein
MIIVLCLYIAALWVVFSKFKLVRWGWCPGQSRPVQAGSFSRYSSRSLTISPRQGGGR